jgi:hypothetical protein
MYSDELLAHFGVSMPLRRFFVVPFHLYSGYFLFRLILFSCTPSILLSSLLFFFPPFYSSFFFSTSLGFRPNMRKAEEKHPVSESGKLFKNIVYLCIKSLLKLQTEYKDLKVYLTWHCFTGICKLTTTCKTSKGW